MTIQRRLPKQAEADCLALAAFLTTNRMIEDSLPVPTANETAHQPQPQHHRPSFFSPQPQRSPPDLPSGTLRRRNTFSRSSSSANRVGGDGAVDDDSLANSSLPLRTSPMLHEHEQEHQNMNMNRQNMNRLPSHHHGRTLQPSPSCARAVLLNQESASGAGGGSGSGIPHLPLPFAVRPKNMQTQHRPLLTSSNRSLTISSPRSLIRDQQGGRAPLPRKICSFLLPI